MYKLRFNKDDYFPHQWDFLTSDKTITGLCGGYGSGKTHIFIRKSLLNMFKRVNKNKDRKNTIIGGHQRVKVARTMGIKEVPCVEIDLDYD